MTWTAVQLLAWLGAVEPRVDGRSHFEWLEMAPSASSLAIQNAYHAIARTRHPDLARKLLGARDHDRLVRMYSRVTSAYAALRAPDSAANYLRERRDSQKLVALTAAPAPVPALAPTDSIDPVRAMNARALPHYLRAEAALRKGDRTTALLQIRMAIAADPRSTLLRAALAELMVP